MKPLAIWVAVVAVVFGGFALVTSSTRNTEQVYVVVDSSFFMKSVAADVPGELDRIDNAEYSEFALATTRDRSTTLVHSWQDQLTLARFEAFGPCSFEGIDQFPEAAEADKRVLITSSATECDTTALAAWTVIALTP
jgi:hypothetical protein